MFYASISFTLLLVTNILPGESPVASNTTYVFFASFLEKLGKQPLSRSLDIDKIKLIRQF